jgi:hypothetical protein
MYSLFISFLPVDLVDGFLKTLPAQLADVISPQHRLLPAEGSLKDYSDQL